jgi:transaldolase
LFKDKVYDIEPGVRRLCALLNGAPLSVEVTTNNLEEMVEQGRRFAALAANIVVKIPIINQYGESCLGVIHELASHGIRVNTTAMLCFNQAMLAAKAGATYVSLFWGRISDEGNDPYPTVSAVRRWLDAWKMKAKIIAGSIRGVLDVQNAALAGAHVVTIPPQFLAKMVDHKYSRDTVRGFMDDAAKALAAIEKEKVAVASR